MNEVHTPGFVPPKIKIRRAIWNVVCTICFRSFPTKLFWPWRRLILRIFGAQLHQGCYVYSSVKIWAPWNLRMEHGTCLGPYVICYNQDLVYLKENATVSQYVYLCTAGHKPEKPNSADEGLITAGITLERDAWIGTRAFIGMGVVVGEQAIVGANAGVYKDVEAKAIVGGNPAHFIKKRVIDEKS